MSYFRNVENDGVWFPGETYTFEVDERADDTYDTGYWFGGEIEYTGYWWSKWRATYQCVTPEGYCHNAWAWAWCPYEVEPYLTGWGSDDYNINNPPTHGGPPDGISVCIDAWPTYEIGEGECNLGDGMNSSQGTTLCSDADSLMEGVCGDDEYGPQKTGGIPDGKILYVDQNENVAGAIEGLTVDSVETLEDGWSKYTVTIDEDAIPGTFYLKVRSWLTYWMIG